MEFELKKHKLDYSKFDLDSLSLAREFAKKIYDEMGGFIKVVSLFGSSAKKKSSKDTKDIDILVVVDDVGISLSDELAETYRIIVEKIVLDVSKKLHITTLRLSTFWEYIRVGDPIGINILRDGIPLIDSNVFEPMKFLLAQGRIRPTKESIWTYFMKVPSSLSSSKHLILKATIDLYWAVMDSSHSALMSLEEVPPSPEHVPNLFKKLYQEKRLKVDYSKTPAEFYKIMKDIEHGVLKSISGKKYDELHKEAVAFSTKMKAIVTKIHPEL